MVGADGRVKVWLVIQVDHPRLVSQGWLECASPFGLSASAPRRCVCRVIQLLPFLMFPAGVRAVSAVHVARAPGVTATALMYSTHTLPSHHVRALCAVHGRAPRARAGLSSAPRAGQSPYPPREAPRDADKLEARVDDHVYVLW